MHLFFFLNLSCFLSLPLNKTKISIFFAISRKFILNTVHYASMREKIIKNINIIKYTHIGENS